MVHPAWVPQLADAEEVLRRLDRRPGVRYPVLVPNLRGLRRALDLDVTDIAVFASATESFAEANLNRTVAESLEMFAPVIAEAREAGMRVRGYLSMCWGDPWEGAVSADQVVGVATALTSSAALNSARRHHRRGHPGAGHRPPQGPHRRRDPARPDRRALPRHLRPGTRQHTRRAPARGDHRGHLGRRPGGCPYAESATGNLATEDLLWQLEGLGIRTGIDLAKLVETSTWLAARLGRPSPSPVVRALQNKPIPAQ